MLPDYSPMYPELQGALDKCCGAAIAPPFSPKRASTLAQPFSLDKSPPP